MYERFYGFRERPFSLTPDPAYLYPSRVHREALSHLRYGIEGHAGFTVITGEIGCGKTTLLQTVLRSIDRHTSISRLMNTMLDARELIEAIMLDFGLEPAPDRSKPYLLRDLASFLVEQRNTGRLCLLIIDEAQNLSIPALEEVRMLSNLETEKSKLIQIVLIGQPNLRTVLARPELEQLRQRVTVSYHIEPLTSDETFAYVNHRLRLASLAAPMTFSRVVTDVIHEHSLGIARRINVIADAILLYGYGSDTRTVDVSLADEAIADLGVNDTRATPAGLEPASTASGAPTADIASGSTRDPMCGGIDDAIDELAASIPRTVTAAADRAPMRPSPASIDTFRGTVALHVDDEPSSETPIVAQLVRHTSPTHRIFCELPPQAEGWWARFRRGSFHGAERPSEG